MFEQAWEVVLGAALRQNCRKRAADFRPRADEPEPLPSGKIELVPDEGVHHCHGKRDGGGDVFYCQIGSPVYHKGSLFMKIRCSLAGRM